MAYSTVAEIESEFKNIEFTDVTNVTTSDVDGFITEADALINTFVGARYTVPVSSSQTSAFNTLKLCSRTLVAGRIRAIMAVKQASNQDANHEGRGAIGFNTADVMKLLRDIRDGKVDLNDGEALVASGGFASFDNCRGPVMKKNERQW